MKHDPILDTLRAAFPPKPIVAASAFEQRGKFYCDTHEYRAHLDGKTWEQLDPQYTARRSDALSFLGDEHMRAVLPMYLYLMLVFKPTSPVPESLLPTLTRPEPTDPGLTPFDWKATWFRLLVGGLSDDQKRVVAVVLRRFIELYPDYVEPAQRALDRYWGVL